MNLLNDLAQARHLVALDLETTTMHASTARIIEITLANLDANLNVTRSITQRLNPGQPIPAQATRIHGIRDIDVADQPVFRDVAARIQGIIKGATLIAYNGRRFDGPVLHRHLRGAGQLGLPQDAPIIDPYLVFTQDSPRTLTAACQYYLQQGHPKAHSSAADVEAMVSVLRQQTASRIRIRDLLAGEHSSEAMT